MHDVIIIGATNRPDILDTALLRPGRVDKIIKVPAPDSDARLSVLRIHSKNVPLGKSVSLPEIAVITEGYSGADLEGLIREAALISMQESGFKVGEVKLSHFEAAMKKITPSVSKETADAYDAFKNTVSQAFKLSYVR